MAETFFTSDPHLGGHELVAGLRGYSSPVEHDAAFVRAWRRQVRPEDTVWVLGDLALGGWRQALSIISGLPGRKMLVVGNHDRCFAGARNGHAYLAAYGAVFDAVVPFARLRRDGRDVLLSHFPYDGEGAGRLEKADRHSQYRLRDEGALLLHGHVHDDVRFRRSALGSPMVHVGLDAWEGRLVTFHEALSAVEAPRIRFEVWVSPSVRFEADDHQQARAKAIEGLYDYYGRTLRDGTATVTGRLDGHPDPVVREVVALDFSRAERALLPSWHSFALPRRGSDEVWCRDPRCRETNWGGNDRRHLRGDDCPPATGDVPSAVTLADCRTADHEARS